VSAVRRLLSAHAPTIMIAEKAAVMIKAGALQQAQAAE